MNKKDEMARRTGQEKAGRDRKGHDGLIGTGRDLTEKGKRGCR